MRDPRALHGLTPHRVGERREALDLGGLALRRLGEPLLVGLARREVLRVRALVLDELARFVVRLAVDVDDARDRVVEEIEIVAHDHERPAVGTQQVQQPGPRVGVEMVRRLVEQEQLASREQDPHELQPTSLTTGERAEGEIKPVIGEPDPRCEASHLRLGRVPAGRLEALLELGEARHVARRRVLFDADPGLLELLLEAVEPLPGEDVAEAARVVGDRVGTRVL